MLVTAAVAAVLAAPARAASPEPAGAPLDINELVRRVLERNEAVQGKILEFEVARRAHAAEYGAFEPEGFASAVREENNRQNNTQQAASNNGVQVFHELNTLYNTGVNLNVPTGTQVQLGYTLSDLNNNIPAGLFQAATVGSQWQSFAGVTVTQPLLKNFGFTASMASLRIAAISSQIAFQQYRRELMTVVGQAEAAYWNLYLAQEQVRFFEESLRTTETILRDNRTRLEAGKGSELDVMEAEAGVGLRRAKLNDARQKLAEAAGQVASLYGATVTAQGAIRAVDRPVVDGPVAGEGASDYQMNPDYLAAREKVDQERVRLGYAKNQRLPELDLKGSYGLNGLGASAHQSLRVVEHTSYPSWSFGVEVRLPLLAGIKSRNDYKAAVLHVTAAELALRSLQTQLANGLTLASQKLARARSSVESYEATVSYNRKLLDSALARLDAGKIDSQKVLEIEGDLFEARMSFVDSQIQYKLAQLEVELISGTLLEHQRLEVSQKQLQAATEKFTRARAIGDAQYRQALDDVHRLYPALAPAALVPAHSP